MIAPLAIASVLFTTGLSEFDLDLDAIRSAVLPTAEELRYEEIPWIAAYGEGLARANEERRPVLFWAMNGHPLGCT